MNNLNVHDLTGKKFGKLTVIERTNTPSHIEKGKYSYWICRCDCGDTIVVSRYSLNDGKESCGCAKKPRKKETKKRKPYKNKKEINNDLTRFKRIWNGMNKRCYRIDDNEYHNYGAKGIVIWDRWLEFENFKEDMYDSYLEFEKVNGEKSATIDRIDPKGNYEPNNCRWATQLEQARNRSNNINIEIEGVTFRTVSEAAEFYKISYQTVLNRYHKGKRGLDLVYKGNLLKPNRIIGSNGEITYIDSNTH